MKKRRRQNDRKHKEIKGSQKYFTLDISLEFDSMENMKITSSESNGKSEKSGKWLIKSLGVKAKVSPQK